MTRLHGKQERNPQPRSCENLKNQNITVPAKNKLIIHITNKSFHLKGKYEKFFELIQKLNDATKSKFILLWSTERRFRCLDYIESMTDEWRWLYGSFKMTDG